ncbi:MAG: DUF899 family protein [Candidatus Dadabacteria bacterium]|nr:DUF899 family protein [Candidatus Dadabacteria bacterium]
MVYYFMFGPDWDKGCPSCSMWSDSYDAVAHHLGDKVQFRHQNASSTSIVKIKSLPQYISTRSNLTSFISCIYLASYHVIP